MQTESTSSIKRLVIQDYELPYTVDICDKKDNVKVIWLMAHAIDLYLRTTNKINGLKWGDTISTKYDTFIWDGCNAVPVFSSDDNRPLLDRRFTDFDLDQEFTSDWDQRSVCLINNWHFLLGHKYDLWLDLSKYTEELLSNMFVYHMSGRVWRYATCVNTNRYNYFISDYHSCPEEQDDERTKEVFKQRFQDTLKKGVVFATSIFTGSSEFIINPDSKSQSTLAKISLTKPIEFGTTIGLVQPDQSEEKSNYDITVVNRPGTDELVWFIERQHELYANKMAALQEIISKQVLPDISKSILGYSNILDY